MSEDNEFVTLSRFFDLEGNKRNFISEDIIDVQAGNLANFIQEVKQALEESWDISKATGSLGIVSNIQQRDKITPDQGYLVWVEDATGDETVKSGGAAYLYRNSKWIKIFESESLDLSLEWSKIKDKPTSSPSEIDSAVALRHAHDNQQILDGITSSSSDHLKFNNIEMLPRDNIEVRNGESTSTGKIYCTINEMEVPDNFNG